MFFKILNRFRENRAKNFPGGRFLIITVLYVCFVYFLLIFLLVVLVYEQKCFRGVQLKHLVKRIGENTDNAFWIVKKFEAVMS